MRKRPKGNVPSGQYLSAQRLGGGRSPLPFGGLRCELWGGTPSGRNSMLISTISMLGLCLLVMALEGSAALAGETGFLDRTVTVNGVRYRYQVYVPVDYTPQQTHPVLLFLHGAGERGDDGLLQTQVGLGAAIRQARARFPFLVVFPQARRETWWVGDMAAQALQALEQTITEFHGDPQRLYLSGVSMGGYGTWYVAARAGGRFAAIVPVCGWVTLPRADLPAERHPARQAAAEPWRAADGLQRALRSRFRPPLKAGVRHQCCRGRTAACPSCHCGSPSLGHQTKGASTMKALAAGSIVLILLTCGWRARSVGQQVPTPQGELRIVDPHPANWAWITYNVFEHLIEIDKEG